MKSELKYIALYFPYDINVSVRKLNDDKSNIGRICGITNKSNHSDWVKVSFDEIISVIDTNHNYVVSNFHNYFLKDDIIKPILRPLSEFGDSDDTRKVHEFIGLGKWCDNYDDYFKAWFNDLGNIDKLILQAPQEIFNYFLANHFDVFGLIGQNLAIDINSLVELNGSFNSH